MASSTCTLERTAILQRGTLPDLIKNIALPIRTRASASHGKRVLSCYTFHRCQYFAIVEQLLCWLNVRGGALPERVACYIT